MSPLGGIVLCGGRGSRMGFPKAWLPFGSETMLERVVRIVGAEVEKLVVVAAPDQDLPPLPTSVFVARDRVTARGPLEGLAVGLKALQGVCTAAFVTGCDAPQLTGAFVRTMALYLQEHDIAVPFVDGFLHTLAAVYRVDLLPVVERLLTADRRRLTFLRDEADAREVSAEELRHVDPALHSLRNLNRLEDYMTALREEGLEPPAKLLEKLEGTPKSPQG